jgi:uncharacterized membrane protein
VKIVSNLFQPTLLSLSTQYYIGEQGMCMFCGLGFYPWMALSTCNHTHEDQNDAASQGSRAIEILKERYAKGEITKEQFMEMRKTIEQ